MTILLRRIAISRSASTTGSTTPSFAPDFLAAIKSMLTSWFSSAQNGIHDLYASVVHSQEVDTQLLCVTDASGGKTCITRSQLNTSQAVERIRTEVDAAPEVEELLEFIRTSQRGVVK